MSGGFVVSVVELKSVLNDFEGALDECLAELRALLGVGS